MEVVIMLQAMPGCKKFHFFYCMLWHVHMQIKLRGAVTYVRWDS